MVTDGADDGRWGFSGRPPGSAFPSQRGTSPLGAGALLVCRQTGRSPRILPLEVRPSAETSGKARLTAIFLEATQSRGLAVDAAMLTPFLYFCPWGLPFG